MTQRRFAAAVLARGCALTTGDSHAGQREVEEGLACQCGCGLTVHACNHLQCSFAVPVREDISRSWAAGEPEDEIIARYVAEYGEKVLSSPTREGFNLLAWWGPYAALSAGALGLLIALGKLRRFKSPDPAGVTVFHQLHDRARADLDRELENYDR